MRSEKNYTLFPNDVNNNETLFALHVRALSGYPKTTVEYLKTLPLHDIDIYDHPEEMLPITVGAIIKRTDGKYLVHKNHPVCCKHDSLDLFDLHSIFSCKQLAYQTTDDLDHYVFSTARTVVAQDFGLLLTEEQKFFQLKDTTNINL